MHIDDEYIYIYIYIIYTYVYIIIFVIVYLVVHPPPFVLASWWQQGFWECDRSLDVYFSGVLTQSDYISISIDNSNQLSTMAFANVNSWPRGPNVSLPSPTL